MKPILFPLLFAIMALISCSKEDGLSSHDYNSNVTYNFSASIPDATNQTKATSIKRYILEVYKTADLTTVVKRVQQAGGGIAISLQPNIDYTCLFWADDVITPNDNTNGTYNASNLKNVTLNAGKEMTEAFFAKLDITNAAVATSFNVILKRAVAQVNLIETKAITANTNLKVTFNRYNSFNTYNSEVAGTAVSTSKTFNSSATIGVVGTLLTFAPNALTTFTVLYNSMGTNEIPNVPLKTNYITNIRGNYSTDLVDVKFTATLDDVWIEIMELIQINVGTSSSPKWIIVADRNADKTTPNGATARNTALDYGYYFNNETNNERNASKACFNFGEGNGAWRLPTRDEFIAISGNGGAEHDSDANRKLKWDGTYWKLYDEREGKTDNFVYFPMAGHSGFSAGSDVEAFKDEAGVYWSSTIESHVSNQLYMLVFYKNGHKSSVTHNGRSSAFSVRCVKDV